jgi:hypothetical protein
MEDGPTHNRKDGGMADTNYLRDSLRAAGNDPLETCTLCGVLINQYYEDAHNRFHQAHYQPFATDPPGAAAETCKLCGVLINQYYQDAHNAVHQARYEPFAAGSPGAAETCKLCGILINQYDRDAHNRSHG